MRARHLCVVVAALVGGVLGLLLSPLQEPSSLAALAPDREVIPQLPEQDFESGTPSMTVDDLQRCLTADSCTTVATADLGEAHVDVIQQHPAGGELPALHFVTTISDAPPNVWSLDGEHGGTYIDLTCALTNCVLTLDVADELRVLLDMRITENRLQALVEGAAFTSSTDVYVFDLNADGVLDAAIAEELWSANSTSPYYRTVVSSHGHLVTTGCTIPGEVAALPTELLSRTCPA